MVCHVEQLSGWPHPRYSPCVILHSTITVSDRSARTNMPEGRHNRIYRYTSFKQFRTVDSTKVIFSMHKFILRNKITLLPNHNQNHNNQLAISPLLIQGKKRGNTHTHTHLSLCHCRTTVPTSSDTPKRPALLSFIL